MTGWENTRRGTTNLTNPTNQTRVEPRKARNSRIRKKLRRTTSEHLSSIIILSQKLFCQNLLQLGRDHWGWFATIFEILAAKERKEHKEIGVEGRGEWGKQEIRNKKGVLFLPSCFPYQSSCNRDGWSNDFLTEWWKTGEGISHHESDESHEWEKRQEFNHGKHGIHG